MPDDEDLRAIPNEEPDRVPEDDALPKVRSLRRSQRVPPNTSLGEDQLLGAMLNNWPQALEAGLSLEPEHFYQPSRGHVYAAIAAVAAQGEQVGVVAVAEQLRRAGLLDAIGGPATLTGLLAGGCLSSQAASIARTIASYARARRVISLGQAITDAGYASDLTQVAKLVDEALESVVPGEGSSSSWATVDLEPVLDGRELDDRPVLLARTDGQAILYRGKVHAFNAEPESGKGWLALLGCTERMAAGEHVVYLDFEDTAATVVGRLLELGVGPDVIVDRFHYIRPDEALSAAAKATVQQVIVAYEPSLVVIDGVTEALVLNDWKTNENDDVARFIVALPRMAARLGPAVVLIDHRPKDRVSRGRYALGAQHKLAGLDVAYSLEVVKPFGRGRTGIARVLVAKDRPGYVREVSAGGHVLGELRLVSTEGQVELELTMPTVVTLTAAGRPRLTGYMQRISKTMERSTVAVNKAWVEREVKGHREHVRDALAALIEEGHVEQEQHGQALMHRLVRPFREDAPEDDDVLDDVETEGTDDHGMF